MELKKNHRDGGHIGHDCMIGYYKVYSAMSYGKVVAWLFCRRTCNRRPIASNVDNMCNNLYGNIVILCHDIPGVMTCTCAYVTCAAARDLCEIVTDTTVTPIEVTAHSIHFPLLCFIHVFICFCLCSAGSIRGGGVEKYVIQCFYRAIKFRVFCTYILSLL